jgi:hypothetical protein
MDRRVWLAVVATACGRIHFANVPDGGGSAAATCNSVTRIFDDFEDGVRDPMWASSYAEGTTTVTEAGGDAVLTLQPNATGTYCGLSTGKFYDLRGQRMTAEIAQTPNTGAEMGLAAQYDVGVYLHLFVQDGMMGAAQANPAFTALGMVPFDPVANRFIAIEEQDGMVLFESSPDNTSFTTFLQTPDPFDLALIRPQLYAGTFNAVGNPGVARFASFDQPVAHAGGCPISTLVDTFSDGIQGHEWENSYANACCTTTETGGTLKLVTDGTTGFTARVTSAGYDLRGGHATVAVPSGPMTAGMLGAMRANVDPNNAIELQVRNGAFVGVTLVAGTSTNLGPVQRTVGQNYIQIVEDAGTIYLQQSSDRAIWSTLYMFPTPFAVDDVQVSLQGGIPSGGQGSDSVWYANFGGP